MSLFKWTYPKEKGGKEGNIPWKLWPTIKQAAFDSGIYLRPDLVRAMDMEQRRQAAKKWVRLKGTKPNRKAETVGCGGSLITIESKS